MTDSQKTPVAPKEAPSVEDKPKAEVKLNFDIPELSEFLKAGVHFGHQTKRWNPKMSRFIYTQRGDIHIIDLAKTYEQLEKALKFLAEASSRGPILFVGTKRQGREIVRKAAVDAGAYFVVHRWVGGLFTNFEYTKKSLKHLSQLENDFETGVQGRTKFEISRMKKDWERLNRLYEGVKALTTKPTAMVILDSKFDKNAVKEAINLNIPIVAIVDTNSDPDKVAYPVPANDDAIGSIGLIFDLFARAVKQGNNGKGVEHKFKDYTEFQVAIKKEEVVEEEVEEVGSSETAPKIVRKVEEKPAKAGKRQEGGILEQVQRQKEEKILETPKTEKSEKKSEPKDQKSGKKSTKKEAKKPAEKKKPAAKKAPVKKKAKK